MKKTKRLKSVRKARLFGTSVTETLTRGLTASFNWDSNNTRRNIDMKKELFDALTAGVALWAAHTVYGLFTSLTGINDVPAVGFAVVGYLTVRIATTLRK